MATFATAAAVVSPSCVAALSIPAPVAVRNDGHREVRAVAPKAGSARLTSTFVSRSCISLKSTIRSCNSRGYAGVVCAGKSIRGPAFVVGDNIDTDQIIPAEYLTLVPSKPDEYEKLGSYAMIGLPEKWGRYVQPGEMKTRYPIMIAGANYGCGSSREHAPVAMGASGCKAVIAESYARIFFRNCVATGELYPYETPVRLVDHFKTGDDVELDVDNDKVINHTSGKIFDLLPLGEAGPVIDAGGIFEFARKAGMIK